MSPAVPDDEYVLRRIPAVHLDPALRHPVAAAVAFRPTPNDMTGLSVYLASAYPGNPAGILADIQPEERRSTYSVVRIPVAAIRAVGLDVVVEEAELPGHAVIPQLTRAAREADKAWANHVQLLLAQAAELVHSPPSTG